MDVVRQRVPQDQEPHSVADRLDTWKEIAEYLKRSVRTVRRWEAEEGLPAHRHLHQNSGTVYAFRAELDAWLLSRDGQLAAESASSETGTFEKLLAQYSSAGGRRRHLLIGGVIILTAGTTYIGLVRFRSVAPQLSSHVIRSLAVPPTGSRPVSAEANRLFFQSLLAASAQTYEGFSNAITLCQQAIEKQPDFAAAYARMALYYLQFTFTGPMAPKQFMPQAEAAARKAVELDETLAEGHAVLGLVLSRFRWDWTSSERELRHALALNPNYSEGHRRFGELLSAIGRTDEALAERERALELDPLSLQPLLDVAASYRATGQTNRAVIEIRKALEKDPNRPRAHSQLGITYLQSGMLRESISEQETAVKLSQGNARFVGYLAYAYAVSGQKTQARKILEELESRASRQYVSPTVIAQIYAGLGERQRALAWLGRAVEERDGELVASQDLDLAMLRSDPTYEQIFARMGLGQ